MKPINSTPMSDGSVKITVKRKVGKPVSIFVPQDEAVTIAAEILQNVRIACKDETISTAGSKLEGVPVLNPTTIGLASLDEGIPGAVLTVHMGNCLLGVQITKPRETGEALVATAADHKKKSH